MSSAGNMEGEVMSTGLKGFHPQNPGIDFIRAYRWGLSGPYLRFVEVMMTATSRCMLLPASPCYQGLAFVA